MPPKKKSTSTTTKAKPKAEKPGKETKQEEPTKDDPASAEQLSPNGDVKDESAAAIIDKDDPKSPADKDAVMSGANDFKKPSTNGKASDNSKKRKEPPSLPREGSRKSARSGPKSQPTPEQLLSYMLSKDAEELCRPDDEAKDLKERGAKTATYTSSVMNPFQELVCAVVLSRPISHMLGLRTIRTIFNPPYQFTSAKKTQAAGSEKHIQALYDAHTQHKDKTAEQLGLVADVVLQKFSSSDDKEGEKLGKVLSNSDVDAALDELKTAIKGFGPTGQEIFLRRVQWLWSDAFPFIDARSAKALKALGLPNDAEQLEKIVDGNWSKLQKQNVAGKGDAEKKRRAFVVILERATGADLEGKIDALVDAAAKG